MQYKLPNSTHMSVLFLRSFGHHQAKKYNVNQGLANVSPEEKSQVQEGFALTRESVTKVSIGILQCFIVLKNRKDYD